MSYSAIIIQVKKSLREGRGGNRHDTPQIRYCIDNNHKSITGEVTIAVSRRIFVDLVSEFVIIFGYAVVFKVLLQLSHCSNTEQNLFILFYSSN